MHPTPALKAFLICDKVIQETGTKKKYILGIFDSVHSKTFPAKHDALAIYSSLTEAEGTYEFKLEFVDLEKDHVIHSVNLPPITINNRLVTHEIHVEIRNLSLPHEGKYEFRLYADERIVGQKLLFAVQDTKK